MAGLYLHIPFCERKCIYCNFYSIESMDARDRFMKAIVREIDMRADQLDTSGEAPADYETVFFGGGTPSLLSPEELGSIVERLRARFTIRPDAEFTMECNPGALTREWLVGYRDLGVNRLSFGVQSFHDDELAFLSRIHTADEAVESITIARGVFDNVSLDLIFALPGQTRERWRHNLARGIELGTEHISAYSLVFEEGTRLNVMRLNGDVVPAADSLEADMYAETMEVLGEHGFHQYEVSNYSRPGRECRHNVGYWERRSYISFGPSAHAFHRDSAGERRWANVSSLQAYLGDIDAGMLPVASSELLSSQLALEESIFLGLRSRGIILEEIRRLIGLPMEEIASEKIDRLVADGYARLDRHRLSLTPKGYPFADRLALELIHLVERELRRIERAA